MQDTKKDLPEPTDGAEETRQEKTAGHLTETSADAPSEAETATDVPPAEDTGAGSTPDAGSAEEDEFDEEKYLKDLREKRIARRKNREKQMRTLWFILFVTIMLSVLTIVFVGTRMAGTITGGRQSETQNPEKAVSAVSGESRKESAVSAETKEEAADASSAGLTSDSSAGTTSDGQEEKKEKASSDEKKEESSSDETKEESAASETKEESAASGTEEESAAAETEEESTAAETEETASPAEDKTAAASGDPEEASGADAEEDSAPEAAPRPVPTAEARPHPADEVWLTATGDNLIHQRLYEQAAARSEDGSYDFSYVYEMVKPFISQHDVNWIDVETLINDRIEPSGYPVFSTPGANGLALLDAGYTVFSLANNHTYDYGGEGIAATLEFWSGALPEDAIATGFWTDDRLEDIPVIVTEQGYTIAFLTYVDFTNADPEDSMPARVIYLHETELIERQIRLARELADAVVVSCHWGEEGSHEITGQQQTAAQNIADWGADIILGDHPHVIQNGAWLTAQDGRQVFCVYSLGNFVSTQELPDELIGQILEVTLKFSETEDGRQVEVVSPALIPTLTVYGEDGADSRVILYRDVLDEEIEEHGIREEYPEFSREYIENVLRANVDSAFLQLPEREPDEEEDPEQETDGKKDAEQKTDDARQEPDGTKTPDAETDEVKTSKEEPESKKTQDEKTDSRNTSEDIIDSAAAQQDRQISAEGKENRNG